MVADEHAEGSAVTLLPVDTAFFPTLDVCFFVFFARFPTFVGEARTE